MTRPVARGAARARVVLVDLLGVRPVIEVSDQLHRSGALGVRLGFL
ncbi:MAG: hypothetical protein Q8K82_21620 [Gemmatimonadaceae bacterium]|nr:hypothetical protein [Gemmatimonadaceae bacterium]